MGLDSYIAKQFKNPTGLGGKMVSAVMNRQNHPLYEETIRLLKLSDDDKVLDIGCGNGAVLKMIAQRYNCELTGVDTSMSILNTASRRNDGLIKSKRITLGCQNVSAMSFADNAFNKVYTVNTVYFWENLNDSMMEIRRVLKPQGFFINTLYSNETLSRFSHTRFGYKRFTAEQLTDAGNNAGFDVDITPVLNNTAYCILYYKRI